MYYNKNNYLCILLYVKAPEKIIIHPNNININNIHSGFSELLIIQKLIHCNQYCQCLLHGLLIHKMDLIWYIESIGMRKTKSLQRSVCTYFQAPGLLFLLPLPILGYSMSGLTMSAIYYICFSKSLSAMCRRMLKNQIIVRILANTCCKWA